MLQNGKMLTDKHINFAQRLLKEMFPEINGLQLTVLQDKEHKEPTTNFQPLYRVLDELVYHY